RFARQPSQYCGYTVTNVLQRKFDIAAQIECDLDIRSSQRRPAAKFVDSVDRVDDFLNGLRNRGFHFFRSSTGKLRPHIDLGNIQGRKAVDAESEITRGAYHDKRQDDHCSKNRTP